MPSSQGIPSVACWQKQDVSTEQQTKKLEEIPLASIGEPFPNNTVRKGSWKWRRLKSKHSFPQPESLSVSSIKFLECFLCSAQNLFVMQKWEGSRFKPQLRTLPHGSLLIHRPVRKASFYLLLDLSFLYFVPKSFPLFLNFLPLSLCVHFIRNTKRTLNVHIIVHC